MIDSVRISSYRCIRELELRLEPLTAIVGPNGSGKSALLTMLNPRAGVDGHDFWQRRDAPPHRRGFMVDGQGPYEVGTGLGVPGRVASITYQLLRLDLSAMRSANDLNPATHLSTNGSDLANVFGTLTRTQQTELAKQLCSLVPLFQDVDVVPVGQGRHLLRYQDRWNGDVWYTPGQVSDGTILVTAFLTLQFQNPPVNLLAIEEPERGLHPYLLEQFVGFLRKLSRGEIGRAPIQVVLATHSPELLEYLEPNEVRFLGRDPADGSTTVKSVPANDPDWPRYFAEYRESLREAWLSGGLGGVPGSDSGG
jgi:predicted ATPase